MKAESKLAWEEEIVAHFKEDVLLNNSPERQRKT
jgi:hypothetical protein